MPLILIAPDQYLHQLMIRPLHSMELEMRRRKLVLREHTMYSLRKGWVTPLINQFFTYRNNVPKMNIVVGHTQLIQHSTQPHSGSIKIQGKFSYTKHYPKIYFPLSWYIIHNWGILALQKPCIRDQGVSWGAFGDTFRQVYTTVRLYLSWRRGIFSWW